MKLEIERLVRARASYRCEYCSLPASGNRFKGPNIAGLDPVTGEISALYHPREDVWDDHFYWQSAWLMGRTSKGRATIRTLNINAPEMIQLRACLIEERRTGSHEA